MKKSKPMPGNEEMDDKEGALNPGKTTGEGKPFSAYNPEGSDAKNLTEEEPIPKDEQRRKWKC